MADISSLVIPVDPEKLLLIGLGGVTSEKAQYIGGKRQETPAKWVDGSSIHRVRGIAVSLDDLAVEGAALETTTPLESVPAGTVFRAEGVVQLRIRADGRPGFNGGGPRGVLLPTLFVQRLVAERSIKPGAAQANSAHRSPAPAVGGVK